MGSQAAAGRLPEPRRDGAMAGGPELAGAREEINSVHKNTKRAHGVVEEGEASSPRGSVRPESKPRARFVVERKLGLGEIPRRLGLGFRGLGAKGVPP